MTDDSGTALTEDMILFDQYLDVLARHDVDGLDPLPTPPVELTKFAINVQAIANADRARPAFGDELFRRMLVAQRAQSEAILVLEPDRKPTISPGGIGHGHSLLRWAALAAVLVIGFIAGALWNDRSSPYRSPGVIAPTVVESPTTDAIFQPGSSIELWRVSNVNGLDIQPVGLGVAPDGNVWLADGNTTSFAIFAPDGSYIESWGSAGTEDGEFSFVLDGKDPSRDSIDIAWASDGSFYVLDQGNFRIQKFGPDRTFVSSFGSRGDGLGQLVSMYSIAVGSDDEVYVVDDGQSVILVFDTGGGYLRSIGGDGHLSSPAGITFDESGNLWVADWGNDRIVNFDASGVFQFSFGDTGSTPGSFRMPNDVAVDAAGNVIVADYTNRRIQILTTDGRPLFQTRMLGLPIRMDLGSDGSIYITLDGIYSLAAWSITAPDAPPAGSSPVAVVLASPVVATPVQNVPVR